MPNNLGDRDDRFELSLFWRNSTLWPVTFCVIAGLSALGAWAVTLALTQRNPFARLALALAAAMTLFALWDARSRKGTLGGGAVVVGVIWVLSAIGGWWLAGVGR
ncbi:MAG: hypothetical protein FJ091_18080 [Deltaproteobacteria bacterium]|nr:hypothetical protein [Deltaproteobacteria bacterium]